ncbi:MAG: DUF5693 family protein [Synergistes sp.]|nr:DUF5693 family protein [Synergistes sp.]
MKINKRMLLFFAFAAAFLLAAAGLMPRISAEKNNKNVAFTAEYKEIASLAYQNNRDLSDVWHTLSALGLCGVAVSEYTGDELAVYNPVPVSFGSASLLSPKASEKGFNRAVLRFPSNFIYADILWEYISKKLPTAEIITEGQYKVVILPGSVDEFKFSAIVPDFAALEFARKNDVPIIFRPAPCTPASGQNIADAFEFLADKYPGIRNITPAGLVAPGYPDIKPFASVMKARGITVSLVEFIKQIGVPALAKNAAPNVIPMHSLTRDEIISRNLSRRTIADRFIRAVHERSIRLIMVHPYDLQSGGRLEVFAEDLAVYKKALEARGYRLEWPNTSPGRASPPAGALACGIVFIFSLWFYFVRITASEKESTSLLPAAGLFLLALIAGGAVYKLPALARLLGGFCGAFVASEAALTALDHYKKNFIFSSLAALFIVLTGGLAIASFYGTSEAALRLTPFSGVKLTLLLPPLMVLFHDLVRRVHPESIGEIIARPALWGELVLIGAVMIALLIMAVRSDNVSNVPVLEVAFRDFMERLLAVRPRTKEFMIGYPALVLYWYLVRWNYIPRIREAVRLAASLAFCSAVNTFCHFHTLLRLSVIRVLNGWWLGMAVGVAFVVLLHFVLLPLCRRAYSYLGSKH